MLVKTIEDDLMQSVCRATEAMKCWLAHRQHFIPVIEDTRMKDTFCTWASDKLYVQASGNGEQLTTLFRALAWNNFHLLENAKRPQEKQPEWQGTFRKKWTDVVGNELTFEIFVQFSSTYCQRKQVGTEMKEVPVYEVICSEVPSEDLPDKIPF